MISFRKSPSLPSQLISDWAMPKCPFFLFTPPISPLFKRPESRREAAPAFLTSFKVLFVCVCVCFFYGSQFTGKKSSSGRKLLQTKILWPTNKSAQLLLSMSFFDIGTQTLQQKNFANWDDRDYKSFFLGHELELTSEGATYWFATPSVYQKMSKLLFIFLTF